MQTILVLSRPNDAHVCLVQEAVQRIEGQIMLCDLADFLEHNQLTSQLSDPDDSSITILFP